MLNLAFSLAFFSVASFFLLAAARSDWRGLIIPNEYSLALVGLFAMGVITPAHIFDGVTLVSGLIAGGIVFVFTIAMYAARAMGGGDTKLASATALLAGLSSFGLFLLVMTLSGGVLALYALATRKHGEKLLPASPTSGTWLARLKSGENKIPYGLAIAAGGIVALFHKWLMPALSGFPGA
jgi:prepilin peptidase CpaA